MMHAKLKKDYLQKELMRMRIRPARKDDDFQAIAQIYLTTWRATYAGLFDQAFLAGLTTDMWHPEKRWQQTVIAETDEGRIVGVCAYGASRTPTLANMGEVYSIYILPAFQHLGLGQQLMAKALAQLKRQYRTAFLWVLRDNVSAVRFYETLGFKLTGTTRDDHDCVEQVFIMQLI